MFARTDSKRTSPGDKRPSPAEFFLLFSLLVYALFCPISHSLTYFPLAGSVVAALIIWRGRTGGFLFLRSPRVLIAIWLSLTLWQFITVFLNTGTVALSPFLRAMNFLPVLVLAGLPCDKQWKAGVAMSSFIVLFSITALVIILGIYQYSSGIAYPFPRQPFSDGRLAGFFPHPIPAAGFFSTLAIFSVSLFLFKKTSAREKALIGALLVIFLTGVLLSQSRTYYVSLAATLPLIFLKKNLKTAAAGTAVFVLFILIAVIFFPPFRSRAASIVDVRNNPSNVERLYLWKVAVDMVKDHPVAGVGYKRWREEVPDYSPKYSSEWKFTSAAFHHAHNEYLTVAAETGLIGLVLFVSLWLYVFYLAFQETRFQPDGVPKALNIGTCAALLNLFIGGIFEENFSTPPVMLLITFFVALSFFVGKEKLHAG